jgi:hypothetical protein
MRGDAHGPARARVAGGDRGPRRGRVETGTRGRPLMRRRRWRGH